ncbi:helix-turn-helix transcriptional regulator [Staphylococcus saprophyticus]|nr:helix-turn-helix transcriptional regulator [Staphylococcus saprophyticus]
MEKKSTVKIGKLIKSKRRLLDISTAKLANEIGVSQPYLSGIENATKGEKPNMYMLYKIFLGLSNMGLNRRELLLEMYHAINDEDKDAMDDQIFDLMVRENVETTQNTVPTDFEIDLQKLLANKYTYNLVYTIKPFRLDGTFEYQDEKTLTIPPSLKANINLSIFNIMYQLMVHELPLVLEENDKEIDKKLEDNSSWLEILQ